MDDDLDDDDDLDVLVDFDVDDDLLPLLLPQLDTSFCDEINNHTHMERNFIFMIPIRYFILRSVYIHPQNCRSMMTGVSFFA